jgi:hypothetical protein
MTKLVGPIYKKSPSFIDRHIYGHVPYKVINLLRYEHGKPLLFYRTRAKLTRDVLIDNGPMQQQLERDVKGVAESTFDKDNYSLFTSMA